MKIFLPSILIVSPDEGDLDSIDKLVDEDVVSDQQGRLHGARRDLERLNDKRPNKQG